MGSIGNVRRAGFDPSPSRPAPFDRNQTAHLPLALGLLVFGLVLLGLLMVYSASYARGYEEAGDPLRYVKRQALAAAVGLVALFVLAAVDYRRWKELDVLLLLGGLLLVAATLVPGVANGGRWIRLGGFNLQPTEGLKVALIVFMAASLHRRRERARLFVEGVWPHLLVLGVAALMTMAQPDFGMALMYVSIAYFLMFLGGARLKHLCGTLLAAAPPLALLLLAAPYRRARLFSFLDPFGDATGAGYQVIQSLVSLGSGGVWGRGLGAGVEKLGYLPAAHTDFIFSVLGEELGLSGALLVLAGFCLLGYWGTRAAQAAPDRFGALLAAGLTFTLCLQAVLNLGVAVGLLPVTGLTLPFISYGGSSLLVSLAMCGMIISVARAR